MKIYEANLELEEILLRHGFLTYLDKTGSTRGKQTFKTSLSSRNSIRFDHCVHIAQRNIGSTDAQGRLTEQDLRALLFFFKACAKDVAFVVPSKRFNFKGIVEKIDALRQRVVSIRPLPRAKKDLIKIDGVLKRFDEIVI